MVPAGNDFFNGSPTLIGIEAVPSISTTPGDHFFCMNQPDIKNSQGNYDLTGNNYRGHNESFHRKRLLF
jgi:hypothetical protein